MDYSQVLPIIKCGHHINRLAPLLSVSHYKKYHNDNYVLPRLFLGTQKTNDLATTLSHIKLSTMHKKGVTNPLVLISRVLLGEWVAGNLGLWA